MSILVLHHSAGNQDRPARDDWISGKRWYNWIIDGQGKLHHFKDNPNQRSCAKTFDLAFSGNFTIVDPRPEQVATWQKFLKEHNFDTITTHGQLAKDKPGCATATACPGRLLEFISTKKDDMPTCEEKLAEAQRFDREERVPQIKRLQDEVKKLTDMVNSPTDGIEALRSQVAERDRILDEKRARIKELEKQIEQGGDAPAELARAKQAWKNLGDALQ